MKYRTKNAQAGAYAKAVGDAFETFIEARLVVAEAHGQIAHFQHTNPGFTCIGRDRFIPTAAGVADWTGMICGSGKYLALECKSTSEAHFMRSCITAKQQRHLEATARHGGVALLLVEFRIATGPLLRCERYAIPWLLIPWRRLRTAESISPAILGGFLLKDDFLKPYLPEGK